MSRIPVYTAMITLALAAIACRAVTGVSESNEVVQSSADSVSGEGTFKDLGCSNCHDGNAGVPAPSLYSLYGAQVQIEDGSTVLADEDYLRESILSPGAKIVSGYQAIMPDFESLLSEEQLQALIDHIKSLAD